MGVESRDASGSGSPTSGVSLRMRFVFVSFFVACLPGWTTAGKDLDKLLVPSAETLEKVGVEFIDALIKKGQMEMAKGAFKTQLEVLEKVHPDQYQKYKKLKVEDLAADAVFQQAQMAAVQPKTGNAFVDMLNRNGIPIGSSLRGIEDAIRTQRDMETQDPSEQIAKAVFEKFQTQILPGLVANIIAGRNPFRMPQRAPQPQMAMTQPMIRRAPTVREPSNNDIGDDDVVDNSARLQMLARRLRSSPRLSNLMENADVAAIFTRRKRDAPLRRLSMSDDDEATFEQMRAKSKLDGKSQLLLGIHDVFGDDDEPEQPEPGFRRAPLTLSEGFVKTLSSNDELKQALQKIRYRVNDVDKYLEPKPIAINPNPQPGYFVPRKIPVRPRKMIPLLIAMDPEEESELRRNPSIETFQARESRVITSLKNNPSLAALFMDQHLEDKLRGREMLTAEQKGRNVVKRVKVMPRLYSSNSLKPIDAKVTQDIEERVVPPLVWIPKGRHTRLRWTGANEREIPGIGTRFILPSLDPTMPALNSAFSTQGRARDEWDTTFKVPNNWAPGDEIGFGMKQNSQRFVGSNGGFDMPAFQL